MILKKIEMVEKISYELIACCDDLKDSLGNGLFYFSEAYGWIYFRSQEIIDGNMVVGNISFCPYCGKKFLEEGKEV